MYIYYKINRFTYTHLRARGYEECKLAGNAVRSPQRVYDQLYNFF